MKKIAILLTVYNRRETTLDGLRSLHDAIDASVSDYAFDVFMTDDGCTDGTGMAVAKEFPKVIQTKGDGNLFWARGMNASWAAAEQHFNYDYFIWLNDDAVLYKQAINLLLEPIPTKGNRIIVSGAFKDCQGNVSYGGRDRKKKLIQPNGTNQKVFFMNGNFTLVPKEVVNEIGHLDNQFIHLGGDWDYGLRAQEKGIPVVLTTGYVGITDRHDRDAFSGGFVERFHKLYSNKRNPFVSWKFYVRHFGVLRAMWEVCKQHITLVCPTVGKRKDEK